MSSVIGLLPENMCLKTSFLKSSFYKFLSYNEGKKQKQNSTIYYISKF